MAHALSNHPNDQHELVPPWDALDPQVGPPQAVALDNGYFSETNIAACTQRGSGPAFFAQPATPPPNDARPKVKLAYKLRTEISRAIYRLRKCTVEPVIGIIKEALGFRPFSLRGVQAAAGEWRLVCLAFNLKRRQVLWAR